MNELPELPPLPPMPRPPGDLGERLALCDWAKAYAQEYATKAVLATLDSLHEQHKHQHNHFACAATVIRQGT